MLVVLIVKAAGQADLSTVLINTEKAAGVDKQAVTDRLLLERQRWSDQKAGKGTKLQWEQSVKGTT